MSNMYIYLIKSKKLESASDFEDMFDKLQKARRDKQTIKNDLLQELNGDALSYNEYKRKVWDIKNKVTKAYQYDTKLYNQAIRYLQELFKDMLYFAYRNDFSKEVSNIIYEKATSEVGCYNFMTIKDVYEDYADMITQVFEIQKKG